MQCRGLCTIIACYTLTIIAALQAFQRVEMPAINAACCMQKFIQQLYKKPRLK